MKHTQKDYEKIIVIQEKVIKSLDATIKAKQASQHANQQASQHECRT